MHIRNVTLVRGVGFAMALVAQPIHAQTAMDFTPEGLMNILETCTRSVADHSVFEHPLVVEDFVLNQSETQTRFLFGDPEVEGGAQRLAMIVVEDSETGAALDCDFRYNPFEETADADIARTEQTGQMIQTWANALGYSETDEDTIVLCRADRAAEITIRTIDPLGVAVNIAALTDATPCTDS